MGDRFEIETLWDGKRFYEKWKNFEIMIEKHYLYSGYMVRFVKDFTLETTVGAYISY